MKRNHTLLVALLAATAAHASSIPLAVPKRAKIVQPATNKLYVSTAAKAIAPVTPKKHKPTPPAATSGQWKLSPRIEDRGREETTYGILLKRSF